MSNSANRTGIVPACLSFLAIYNPSLSNSEESLHDQIVYYYTKADGSRTGRKSVSNAESEQADQERNEQLRQIGLAQGMVEFAKSFNRWRLPIQNYADTTSGASLMAKR